MPCETKYAAPVSGTGSTGVRAVACPTTEAAGQPAGFASNWEDVQAFCSVVNRDGSYLGSSTLTLAMFDCELAWLAPSGPVG